jgi:hypothetical protein
MQAGISRDKVIPLYGRGNTDGKDPRDKVPPRPQVKNRFQEQCPVSHLPPPPPLAAAAKAGTSNHKWASKRYGYPSLLTVEGLYCKRPIQCLASSEILMPHWPLPHRPASLYPSSPPPLVRGEDTLAGWRGARWVERGWGVNSSIVRKTPDTALYSISK